MSKTYQLLQSFVFLVALGISIAGCQRDESDRTATRSSGERSAGVNSSGSAQSGSSAGGSSATMQRAERLVDDSVITTKAKSALLADTTVKGSDIHVETNQGIVTLSGTVGSDRQKDRAASIVRGLDGVKSVENKMTIKKQ